MAANANQRSLGRTANHRPLAAHANIHGPAAKLTSANTAPPRLVLQAAAGLPCMTCDHDVVMPHDGQGRPDSIRNVHGGRPSCRWVPRPLGSGCNTAAAASAAISAVPAAANRRRCLAESSAGNAPPVGRFWGADKGAEDNDGSVA